MKCKVKFTRRLHFRGRVYNPDDEAIVDEIDFEKALKPFGLAELIEKVEEEPKKKVFLPPPEEEEEEEEPKQLPPENERYHKEGDYYVCNKCGKKYKTLTGIKRHVARCYK